MTMLNWFDPLDAGHTFDELAKQWAALLSQARLQTNNENPHYRDAVVAFVGQAPIRASLKLALVLAAVSSDDLDPRLAVAVLDDEAMESDCRWPSSVATVTNHRGPGLDIASDDCWLLGFIHGRLQGLRDTMPPRGEERSRYRTAFWSDYLAMASRWGNLAGVDLAMLHGAATDQDDFAAVSAAARCDPGPGSRQDDRAGLSSDHYHAVLDRLLSTAQDHDAAVTAALRAAAAADNLGTLEHLQGIGLHVVRHDQAMLSTAAYHGAVGVLTLLLTQTRRADAGHEAALVAAASALNASTASMLLDAGAGTPIALERALEAARTALPTDMFGAEADFAALREDMVALLVEHGAQAE